MPYEVVIWCDECFDENPDGCFLGGTETIDVDPNTDGPIISRTRAERIGYDATRDVDFWRYEVNEVADADDA